VPRHDVPSRHDRQSEPSLHLSDGRGLEGPVMTAESGVIKQTSLVVLISVNRGLINASPTVVSVCDKLSQNWCPLLLLSSHKRQNILFGLEDYTLIERPTGVPGW